MVDVADATERAAARALLRERERAVWTPIDAAGRAMRQAELSRRVQTQGATQADRDGRATRAKAGERA